MERGKRENKELFRPKNKKQEINKHNLYFNAPLTDSKAPIRLSREKVKELILNTLNKEELDKEAIKALLLLNKDNRNRLYEEEKRELDKKIVDSIFYEKNDEESVLKAVVDALVKGANVNAKNELHGETALMYAAEKGYLRLARLLLEVGADVNAKEEFHNKTALMYAAEKGYSQTVKLLINYGANVNIKTNHGWTALMYAAKNNHTKSAELLINKGVGINAQACDGTHKGWTALMLAVDNKCIQSVKLLLDYGADLDIQATDENHKGWTALMLATRNTYTKIVKLLLKYKAGIFIFNEHGETALTLAIKGYKEYENASKKEDIETRRRYLEVINLLLTKLFQMGFNIDKSLDEIDDSIKNIETTLKKECNEETASFIKQRIEQ